MKSGKSEAKLLAANGADTQPNAEVVGERNAAAGALGGDFAIRSTGAEHIEVNGIDPFDELLTRADVSIPTGVGEQTLVVDVSGDLVVHGDPAPTSDAPSAHQLDTHVGAIRALEAQHGLLESIHFGFDE